MPDQRQYVTSTVMMGAFLLRVYLLHVGVQQRFVRRRGTPQYPRSQAAAAAIVSYIEGRNASVSSSKVDFPELKRERSTPFEVKHLRDKSGAGNDPCPIMNQTCEEPSPGRVDESHVP